MSFKVSLCISCALISLAVSLSIFHLSDKSFLLYSKIYHHIILLWVDVIALLKKFLNLEAGVLLKVLR